MSNFDLKPFMSDCFIETDTGKHGGGIQSAIDAGFPIIHGIEIGQKLFSRACYRFRPYIEQGKVRLWHGNPVDMLPEILCNLQCRATFLLGNHLNRASLAGLGKRKSLLYAELGLIGNHIIRNHVIIINNRRLFRHSELSESGIRKALLKINPAYTIEHQKNDIIIADIK